MSQNRFKVYTYPVSANGDVENDKQGALTKCFPSVGVSDLSTCNAMKDPAIAIPGNSLGSVVAAAAIKLDSPYVEVAIGKIYVGRNTTRLVADSSRGLITVDSTVANLLAVDVFEDINLSTCRPLNATTDGFTKEPKGRPDTLLASSRVTTKFQLCLHSGDLASFGGESVLALNTSRRPSAIGISRDQLKRVLSCLA